MNKVFGLLVLLFSSQAVAVPPLAEIITKIKPSIVGVGSFMPKRTPPAVFLGTGFAVGDGSLIASNAHVIPTQLDTAHWEQLAVFYHDGHEDKVIFVKEVARDDTHDVAVLKMTGVLLSPLVLGEVASVREGQIYAFTGFPMGMVLGLYPVTHRGMISAITPNVIPTLTANQLQPKLLRRLADPYNVFQLDATAYPGNSGSPLYDVGTGDVIGIMNKVFVQESKENILSKPSGISYAIPIDHLKNMIKNKQLY